MKKFNRNTIKEIIETVSDETGNDDGYWIYLKPGWINCVDETHHIHEDTKRKAFERAVDIEKCECDECVKLLADENKGRM